MKPIQSCLWFDTRAEAAAKFYSSVFASAKIDSIVPYGKAASKASGQPEGSVMTVQLDIAGTKILLLNGGPHFKLNPTSSFFVGCETEAEIDGLWHKLARTTRMGLQAYAFAKKYGWCEDEFGVNWQLFLGPRAQKVAPALLFSNSRFGKAAEAIAFYAAQFPDSRIESIARDEKTGAVLHAVVRIAGQDVVVMEGPIDPKFELTPAFSFIVNCESQKEIDDIWAKLSAVPQAEICGWLMDKYGLSWQVAHKDWGKIIAESTPEKRDRLMSAILSMKKPNLEQLDLP